MTLKSFIEYLKSSLGRLGWYSQEEIGGIGRILVEEIASLEHYKILTEPQRELDGEVAAKLENAVARMSRGEPLQYVLGYGWFCGYRFRLCGDVLIPRPETEELVEMVLGDLERAPCRPASILDICTGSGCIAWVLQKKLPECRVFGCDISEKALQVASSQFAGDGSENSPSSGVPFFFRYDALSGGLGQNSVGAPYDIIISNPPYVCESEKKMMRPNVLDHEPGLALFVPDENPLLFYAKIADSAAKSLKHGGKLYFEINEKFPEQVVRLMEKYGFGRVEASNDLYGKPRFVKGVLEQA